MICAKNVELELVHWVLLYHVLKKTLLNRFLSFPSFSFVKMSFSSSSNSHRKDNNSLDLSQLRHSDRLTDEVNWKLLCWYKWKMSFSQLGILFLPFFISFDDYSYMMKIINTCDTIRRVNIHMEENKRVFFFVRGYGKFYSKIPSKLH